MAPDPWTRLGEALRSAGFGPARVARALGLPDFAWNELYYGNLERPLTQEDDLVDVLVRGSALPEERARAVLPAEAWECGLMPGGRGRAEWLVLPADGDLVLADRDARSYADDDGLYISDKCTLLVRRSVPSAPVDRHLDLGSGNGAIAVVGARSARETVGLDLNPRAAPVALRTAALNGVAGLTALTGDIALARTLGRFDRVTFTCPLLLPWTRMRSLPLHTVSPRRDLLAATLRMLPSILADDGLALIFCQSWAEGPPLPVALDRAFGERRWRAAYWWFHEAETLVGRLRLGLLAVRADWGWGWREVPLEEPGPPGVEWWPHVAALLGEG